PGVPAALSQGVLADATLFGRTAFELYDFASSGVLMPLVAIATALFVGRAWTRTQFADALGGTVGRPSRLAFALRVLLRWVAPVAIAVVLVRGWIG
nr:sodium-dependent transporter [Plasticicumulans sp.]